MGVFWLFSRVIRGEFSAIFAQASLSRLGERCRVSCLGIGSPFSPRRPSIGVERIVSRSGERRSPKRDRDVN